MSCCEASSGKLRDVATVEVECREKTNRCWQTVRKKFDNIRCEVIRSPGTRAVYQGADVQQIDCEVRMRPLPGIKLGQRLHICTGDLELESLVVAPFPKSGRVQWWVAKCIDRDVPRGP